MKMKDILTALGPLAPLYEDPEVLGILVDSPSTVYVDRQRKLEKTAVQFDSPEAIRATIDMLMALAGIKLSPENPVGEMRFPDDARLIAIVPPTSLNGPTLIIHKMILDKMTWARLFEYGSITPEARDFLQAAINAHVNILVAGGPASGKTTVVNMLAEMVPANQRFVIVEEIHEFNIDHQRAVWLEAGGPADITMPNLLKIASKMRPDWLIVSEFLGGEAMFALQVMSVGWNAIAPIYATSPEDALARLETFCLMANLGLGLSEIRRLIASAVQLITYQQRLPDGSRKFTHFVELEGLDDDLHYKLKPLFRYNPDTDKLERTDLQPKWTNKS